MNTVIKYLTAAAAICTVFVFYIYVLFIYPFAFNYETHLNGQYLAALTAVAGLTLVWALNMFRKEYTRVQLAASVIITLLLLVPLFSNRYSFANEYWAVVCAIAILFVCMIFLPAPVMAAFPYFLVLLLFWQLGLAFIQMDGLNFDAGTTNLQGSLQNSGVFSCYLAIHLPLLYRTAFHGPVSKPAPLGNVVKWLKVIVFTTTVGFIAFIIYSSQSRSAILGGAAAIVSQYLFIHGKALKAWFRRLPKRAIAIFISVTIIFTCCAAWYLFFLKKASAMGRAMKWEIAGEHLGDHFFTGTGIGRFSWYYPQWQAQYFATNPHPPEAYFFSAGESYIIFNEYLQLLETTGIIGLACFALLLYWFFTSRSHRYAGLLQAIKATMIALLVTALTTYTFHINVFLVLMAVCFAITAAITHNHSTGRIPAVIPVLMFLFSACMAYTAYEKWKAAESWKAVREGQAVAPAIGWPELNRTLPADGKFLTEYGRWQLDNGGAKAAVVTLEKARQYFISRRTIEALAMAYEQTGNYSAALACRCWLCDFLPNKFAPRYELLQLYKLTGDTTAVKKMTNIILTMPVKIPSAEVDRIKSEAKKLAEKL